KQMMIAAVDDRNANVRPRQAMSGFKPAKARANDDNAMGRIAQRHAVSDLLADHPITQIRNSALRQKPAFLTQPRIDIDQSGPAESRASFAQVRREKKMPEHEVIVTIAITTAFVVFG